MTVSELIANLRKFDQDEMIVLSQNSQFVIDLHIRQCNIERDANVRALLDVVCDLAKNQGVPICDVEKRYAARKTFWKKIHGKNGYNSDRQFSGGAFQ